MCLRNERAMELLPSSGVVSGVPNLTQDTTPLNHFRVAIRDEKLHPLIIMISSVTVFIQMME